MICPWAEGHELELEYHNTEWGVPSYDDRYLFEMLVLEGAQAGLSWLTILKKREGYRAALKNFDLDYCAQIDDEQAAEIFANYDIIKNRLKMQAIRKNAIAVKEIQKEFGSFSNYVWHFTDGKPIINHWDSMSQMPATSELSERVSKDLKKRGCNFVGPTIIYSYLQACGVIDDHIIECPYHTENR